MFGANPPGWPYLGQAYAGTTTANEVDPLFIGSVTVVYSPTLPPEVYPPFIASVTQVFAPRLPSQPLVTNTFIKIRFSL